MCISDDGKKSDILLEGVCRNGKWYTLLGGFGCNDGVWPCDAGICNPDKYTAGQRYYCQLRDGEKCNDPNECLTEYCNASGVCSQKVLSTSSTSAASTTTLCATLNLIKYEDLNGNGIKDSGEPGLAGFNFSVSGPSHLSLKTNSYGSAYVSCIIPGAYTITEVVPAGWEPTQGNPQQVSLDHSYSASIYFGNKKVTAETTSSTTTTTSVATSTSAAQTHSGGEEEHETTSTTSQEVTTTIAVTTTTVTVATTTVAVTSSTVAAPTTSIGATTLTTSTLYDTFNSSMGASTTVMEATTLGSTLYDVVGSSMGTPTTEVVSIVTYVSVSTQPGGETVTTHKPEPGSDSDSTMPGSATTMPKEAEADDAKLLISEGSEPVADAGGPYTAAVGMPVVFNASKSVAAGSINRYIWDYGDGQSSEGPVTEHVYVVPGLYRATLSIIDEVGRSDLDSKPVYISESGVYIDISAYPQQERYKIGEVLSTIEASVYYFNGSGIDGLSLSGMLSGRVNVSLDYAGIGKGKYRARLDYPIMNGEGAFIDIYVNASGSNKTNVSAVKKLILVPKNSDLRMIIQDPAGRSFAYGQSAGFKIIFNAGGKRIDSGEITLYEEWTNNKYPFQKEGNNYVLTYNIPEKARSHIPLIIYGSAEVDGKIQPTVKDLSLDLSHDLLVTILSPKNVDDLSKTKEVRLQVMYPDGTIVSDPVLEGTIQERRVSFAWDGQEYAGAYVHRRGDSKLYVWVEDGYGNGGGADVSVTEASSSVMEDLSGGQTMLYATGAIILLVCVFFALRIYSGRRKQRAELLKEYESILQKINGLKDVRKNLMHEYYTRKISEQDARKGIIDFEHEMIFEKGRLKQVMQRLGMRYTETEGKEDLLEWIAQKLSSGENPELLKKGLSEVGLDSGLVDRVKATLK